MSRIDEIWEALKTECCKAPPDEAKMIIFLTEKKFRTAMEPILSCIEGRGVEGYYAPSSARENMRLLDAIEQSIRSLSQPLGPMETATRVKLVADHGLSYVAALCERLNANFATTPTAGGEWCAERDMWRAAIRIVDTAPLCHCAGKQYIDPVALVQRMNDALESCPVPDEVDNDSGLFGVW